MPPIWARCVGLAGLALIALGCSSADKTYYAIERAGVVMGYMEISSAPGDSATGEPTIEHGKMVNRLTLLGKGMDVIVEGERGVDPTTGRTLYSNMEVRTGKAVSGVITRIDGDTLRYTTTSDGETRNTVLDPDVLVGDSFDFSYLTGLGPGDAPVTRRLLDEFRGVVYGKTFTAARTETLIVDGVPYACVVFDTFNESTGGVSRMWIEQGTARFIRDLSAEGTSITISDASVRRRVRRANIDDTILAEVDVDIEDVRAIAAMTVRAELRTTGQRVTSESLNVPGQRFSGTVENNRIEGVFEIEHAKYDGASAPPFPPSVGPDLERYLEPELAIESSHPAIVAKARELTAGASDSWQAACTLSYFVATEIGADIPGGGSAIGTLEMRKAECGGHSRLLAALCRAVGIPARTVMGCMYTNLKGGSFGQHMWNEVHMGKAGWIPIDATAAEVDYVDSGHIRLGTLTSFNPIAMDVIDFAVGPPVPDPRPDRATTNP